MSADGGRRFYRALLRLFPRGFRAEFGEEMERLFVERCREVERRPMALGALWTAALWDVVSQAALEHGRRAWTMVRRILNGEGTMDGWMQDLRFAVRGLARRPGFALAAVGTLALGIGATVAIFSVVDGVLFRPLPYPDSDRLAVVWKVNHEQGDRSPNVDHPDVRAWEAAVPGLELAGYAGTQPTLTGLGDPEVVYGMRVTDGLLSVFGLEPALGRDLRREDDVPDGPRVVVLSHRFWTERLGADPGVLGRTLTLGGEPWEMVGVAPEGFDYPGGVDLWMPRRHPAESCGHGCNVMNAVARIPAGASLEDVEARLHAVDRRLAEEFPNAHRDVSADLERLQDYLVADVRSGLWVLLVAVGMVLLIACANVASLLMVRAAGRREEMAVRATLGASRGRLVRQLLTESALLAALGGALGLGLAAWAVSGLVGVAPPDLPRLGEIRVGGGVVLLTGGVVAAVTTVFGLVPALRLGGAGAAAGGARTTGGGRRSGLSRSLLLTGEVALSLGLLLGAGLLFRTLQEIRSVELGFQTENVERFRIATPESRYDVQGSLQLFRTLEERLQATPRVRAAGMAFGVPLAPGRIGVNVNLLDREEVSPPDRPVMDVRPASPGYREASGIPLLRGRWIEAADQRETRPVVVINQAAAERFYPGEDPVGKRLELSVSWGFDDDPPRTVVGVVGDVRTVAATRADEAAAYLPNAQFGADIQYVVLHLADGSESVVPRAREILRELDPGLAVTRVERLEDVVRREGGPTRFYLMLLGLFSGLAVALAAVGLYGVVAYAVSRRTREIGIRMALGARRQEVVGLVLRQGVAPAAAGIVLGLAGSWFGARALRSVLYGVEPQDPLTLGLVTALLVAVVLTATWIPARRASRVPPASALRTE